MNFSKIILESRVDDFKNKYSKKFKPEQLNRIIASVPQKFLEWVGKTFDTIDFENNFQSLVEALTKFEKISSNLPLTDINQYKDLTQLKNELEKYQNKPRREYQQVQGGNVVYDDGKYFVVNPQTHQASCYYGKGTKWCTVADSDYQFKRYNDEGKLFYILDRTKQTSDPNYKVALLKNFDGEETFFDAQDKSFKNYNLITGEETFKSIMDSVNEYMNQEYAEQIKIFSDKLAAKKEKERIERLRIQRILNQRRAEAESRRLDGDWELGPDCPEEGLKAHALLDWLDDQGDIELKTNEDRIEIDRLKNEISRLQTEYDESEDTRTDLLDEISDLDSELEELENKVDVYNVVPTGNHYYLTEFEVIDAGLNDRRYAVGDEDEMKRSCYEYVENLIDDIGYEGFNKSFALNYLDQEAIEDRARDYYDDDVRNNPDVYFDESERMLSDRQEEKIEILKMKIERAESSKESLEEYLEDSEDDSLQDKIDELDELIEEYQQEIEEIESSPDGDFPEDIIDDKVQDLVRDVTRDPESFISDFGLDWEDFIDKDDFIEGVIDEDGYGHTLNGYDGNADEMKVENNWFWVMRID